MEITSRRTSPSWTGLPHNGMEITSRQTSLSWTGLPRNGMEFLWADVSAFGNFPGSPGDWKKKALGLPQDFWPRDMRGRQKVLTPRRLGGGESDVQVLVRLGRERRRLLGP